MENDDTHGSSWAELCARHEATSSEAEGRDAGREA
jgi:hypothetical protein